MKNFASPFLDYPFEFYVLIYVKEEMKNGKGFGRFKIPNDFSYNFQVLYRLSELCYEKTEDFFCSVWQRFE